MNRRNKNLISTDTAQKLQFFFMTMDKYTVDSIWKQFAIDEKHVASNIVPLVDTHAKSILSSMMRSMNEPDETEGNIEFKEEGEGPGEHSFDNFISEALSIGSVYDRIAITFKVMFLYGMYSGRAITDSQFADTFNLDNITEDPVEENIPTGPPGSKEMEQTFQDIMNLFAKLTVKKKDPDKEIDD